MEEEKKECSEEGESLFKDRCFVAEQRSKQDTTGHTSGKKFVSFGSDVLMFVNTD